MMKNNKFVFLGTMSGLMLAVAFVVAPVLAQAAGYAQIGNTTLKVGSKGESVRALQQLLASSADIYPSGSQDGNFGTMTKNAVIQFQLAYNLSADGVVGANTRNKVNNLALSGMGIDIYNTGVSNLSVSSSGSNEIISFNSSEPVKAAVFYDTNNINWNNWNDEVKSLSTPQISGIVNVDNTFSTNKQFTLSGLYPNTRYNYTITTTDQAGNTSVIWPTTFYSGQ